MVTGDTSTMTQLIRFWLNIKPVLAGQLSLIMAYWCFTETDGTLKIMFGLIAILYCYLGWISTDTRYIDGQIAAHRLVIKIFTRINK